MSDIFPDLLRAVVSTTMNVVLMRSLLQPKYSKLVTNLAMLGVMALDFLLALYFYHIGNLTLLAKLDIVVLTVLCFAIKPLFRETFMQWLFSYITVQNVNVVIVVLSFIISRYLPMPVYANTLVRLVLYLALLLLLRYLVRTLYRQVVEQWNIFFYVALAIFINLVYYFLFSGNIVATLTEQKLPLLLLIALSVAAYFSVFSSLKNLSKEYAVREENIKLQTTGQLLRQSAQSMEQRLALMDEAARQICIVNHDRRHFNNTMLELIQQGNTQEAIALLQRDKEAAPIAQKTYCENPAANAAIGFYVALAEKVGVACDIHAQIPAALDVDSLELSMLLSNLMENAVNACTAIPEGTDRWLRMTVLCDGQLIVEVENLYTGEIKLDKNNCPTTTAEGHGIGTKSVLDFARRYSGEVVYHIADGVFNVRLLV